MIDNSLVDSLAFLDGIDKLVEAKAAEYLDPAKIVSILEINYQDTNNLMIQLSKYASQSLFYNALTARLNSSVYQYEENVFNKYLAHCRPYGSLYCNSIEKKDTKDGISDAVILIFSRDNSADSKFTFAMACFEESLKSGSGCKDLSEYKKSDEYVKNARAFYAEMYKYDLQGKYYETFIEQKSKLEYRRDLAKSLADSLTQLGICTSQIVKLRLSGSAEIATINTDTVRKLRKMQQVLHASKEITDEDIVKIINA